MKKKYVEVERVEEKIIEHSVWSSAHGTLRFTRCSFSTVTIAVTCILYCNVSKMLCVQQNTN